MNWTEEAQNSIWQIQDRGRGKHSFTAKRSGAHGSAIQQIVSQAIIGTGIVDVFHAAGLKSPHVRILDDASCTKSNGCHRRTFR